MAIPWIGATALERESASRDFRPLVSFHKSNESKTFGSKDLSVFNFVLVLPPL